MSQPTSDGHRDAAADQPAGVVVDPPRESKGRVDAELDQETGLEIESEDDSVEIKRPFDPRKIKVRTTHLVVDQVVTRIRHKEIDLSPDFQRKAGIWDAKRKSRLVESLLLRIPIPVFYVAANEDDLWSVVDGIQRITTLYDFINGRFPLTRLEYLTQFDGAQYGALPRSMQRRISETQLIVNVIEPGTPEDVMFNIFRRINTGGLPLTGQEIRHALHPGAVRDYLKTLADTQEFLDATNRSVKPDRMADRECVLRFLAFYSHPWEKYEDRDLDGYLSSTMKNINAMHADERESLTRDFRKAMWTAYRVFGDDAFRKRYDPQHWKKPVSKPLFEAWSVGFARCSGEEIVKLVENRDKVVRGFMWLLNDDPEFEQAISLSTNQPRRIRKRFEAIHDLIREIVSSD